MRKVQKSDNPVVRHLSYLTKVTQLSDISIVRQDDHVTTLNPLKRYVAFIYVVPTIIIVVLWEVADKVIR